MSEPLTRARGGAGDLATYVGRVQTAAGLAFLAALWLVVSPWVLGQQRALVPTWDQVAVGGLVAVVAAMRLAAPVRLERLAWADFALGAWTVCSAFALSYPPGFSRAPTLWNHIATGTILLVLAARSAAARDSYLTRGRPRRSPRADGVRRGRTRQPARSSSRRT